MTTAVAHPVLDVLEMRLRGDSAPGARRDPQLRRATETWLEAKAERPDDVPAADWLRWEQEKHQRLLAAAAETATALTTTE